MAYSIRSWTPDDCTLVSAIATVVAPHFVSTPEVIRWSVESTPAVARQTALVAADGGDVLGFVRAQHDWESDSDTLGVIDLAVDPAHRAMGAGTRLLEAAEDHLRSQGVRTVELWVEAASAAWAEARGYRRQRTASQQWLDLREELPPVPDRPEGLEVRPFAQVGAVSRTVWELDLEASSDEPGSGTAGFGYEEWRERWKDHPALDPELSLVVFSGDVPAGHTTAFVDGHRYRSGLTGVRRAFRGRGYAKYVKAVSLHAARDRGIREATTGNDSTNDPMLAVNRWLGYRPRITEVELRRDLD
ncbi:GNAT family N-acetyltransferase [Spiractinospora alimapuensis]|uniref:GNAT family N-acetyltransferase n=1 Tax=Spiractinospora alimapuensis TaxID=2820884 RepID=UPI001F198259|nr:GNAT family N-acetyltransferase [Spiractinospora alimapuensis]QVQ52098.1 GNAT family N-acetyltransferase [Spiractinospora alimapuensis]